MSYEKLDSEAVLALRALEAGVTVTASMATLTRLLHERLISIGAPPDGRLVLLRRGRHVLRGCDKSAADVQPQQV
jgi:hypothetical protein